MKYQTNPSFVHLLSTWNRKNLGTYQLEMANSAEWRNMIHVLGIKMETELKSDSDTTELLYLLNKKFRFFHND